MHYAISWWGKKGGTAPPSGDSEERLNGYSCESCQREQNLNTDVMRGDDTVSSITGLQQCGEKLASGVLLAWLCVHVCMCAGAHLSCKSVLPYLTAETRVLHTEHRILFGNMNRGGHSHRQTWFCGISRRWGLRSSGPEPASSPPPSS